MNSGQEHRGPKGRRGRSKREEILIAATERFGRDGYEHTKWADIARDVGVGPTALYHYFESKQHCLYEIMAEAIEDFRARFARITSDEPDTARALTRGGRGLVRAGRAGHAPQPGAGRRAGPALAATARPRVRRSRARPRGRERATSSSRGRASCRGDARRARSRRPTPACSRTRSWGSTTASGSWYRPGGPVALARVARVLHAADPDHGGRGAAGASDGASGRMSDPAGRGQLIGGHGRPRSPCCIGSECRRCGTVTFPRQDSCPRCTSTDVAARRLARVAGRCGPGRSSASGRSRRRTPATTASEFEPYGVGYVELPGEVRVEARLTESDPARLASGWRWS